MIDNSQVMQDVLDGVESPYIALFMFKEQSKVLKEMIEVMEVEAFNQSVYEDKTFEKDGFKIEKRNGRKQWNFKNCKSFQLASGNLEEIKSDLKANFSLYEKGKSSVDEDGVVGEVPLVTYAKDSIIIKKL